MDKKSFLLGFQVGELIAGHRGRPLYREVTYVAGETYEVFAPEGSEVTFYRISALLPTVEALEGGTLQLVADAGDMDLENVTIPLSQEAGTLAATGESVSIGYTEDDGNHTTFMGVANRDMVGDEMFPSTGIWVVGLPGIEKMILTWGK